MNRALNLNTLLSTMVSRSIINPLNPGNDPATNRPNNPTFCPVTGETVYKFLMTGLQLPTINLDSNLAVGGDAKQPPAEKVAIRTETTVIRSNTTNFYSDKENIDYLIPETGEHQPEVTAVLRTSQTGRLKAAPYPAGNPTGDSFENYDNYGQRLSRQKYKAFFEGDD